MAAYASEPFTADEEALDPVDDWARPRTGATGPSGPRRGTMQRGEIWFATVPGGRDRPVLVLTRDPVADRIDRVVAAALTRTRRGVVSELVLTVVDDDVPSDCVVSFDNLHTLPRHAFRRRLTTLSPARTARACQVLRVVVAC